MNCVRGLGAREPGRFRRPKWASPKPMPVGSGPGWSNQMPCTVNLHVSNLIELFDCEPTGNIGCSLHDAECVIVFNFGSVIPCFESSGDSCDTKGPITEVTHQYVTSPAMHKNDLEQHSTHLQITMHIMHLNFLRTIINALPLSAFLLERATPGRDCGLGKNQGSSRNNFNIRGKFGVPSPVTGSQPVAAEKPSVPQPGLLPAVISFITPEFA